MIQIQTRNVATQALEMLSEISDVVKLSDVPEDCSDGVISKFNNEQSDADEGSESSFEESDVEMQIFV